MIRRGAGLGGRPWGLNGTPAAVPPAAVAVSGLQLTSATSSSLTLAFTAPPTGSIVWNVRVHGAGAWTVAAGNFGSSTATITGLTASTAYDVQAIASNNGGTAPAELDSLSTLAAAQTPSTGAATRIDVVFSQSAVSPGGTVSGYIVPNNDLSGNTVTLTPGSGAATVVTLPSSGNAPVPFTLTAPSVGDDYFTITNSAGLLNPAPQQINVFAASSGTSRTFSATIAGTTPDLRTFRRNAVTGDPTGFSMSGKGWGSVGINISNLSGATDGVWMRPYVANSPGATTSPGTGTALHSAVQVHGALGATGTIYPLLPSSLEFLYWDIATDAAFTAPVRIAQRCRVGFVLADISRSQETGFAQYYADNTAFTAINTRFAVWTSGDYRYPANSYTGIHWTISTDTSAGQELARILEAQLGVGVALTGLSTTGNGLDAYFAHDGSPSSAFTGTVAASCDGKFDALTVSMGGWDGINSTNYPTETWAEDQTRMLNAFAKIQQLYPTCQVIRWCSSASGWFGYDGSRDLGYTRVNGIVRAAEASNPCVVSGKSTLWNELVQSHATQAARPDYARTAARMILSAIPTTMGGIAATNRGPTLGSTGSVVGRILRIPYTLHGGNSLTSVKATYANPNVTYSTASTAELASLFSVYAGPGGRTGNGTAIKIASAAINASLGTIDLTLVGSSGVTYADNSTGAMPSGFNVHYAADFGTSNTTLTPYTGTGASLCDDVTEYSIPYGRLTRPALDIAVT